MFLRGSHQFVRMCPSTFASARQNKRCYRKREHRTLYIYHIYIHPTRDTTIIVQHLSCTLATCVPRSRVCGVVVASCTNQPSSLRPTFRPPILHSTQLAASPTTINLGLFRHVPSEREQATFSISNPLRV